MFDGDDAVDEERILLCCAMCCVHCGLYTGCDCAGCSGKIGLCCLNCQVCCKMDAPCLPLICCGPKIECDGCSIMNIQLQACCLAITAALPCNSEVPPAVAILGVSLYPRCGVCLPQKQAMDRY